MQCNAQNVQNSMIIELSYNFTKYNKFFGMVGFTGRRRFAS